ncbi:MAG: CRISPR-associated endonuclease Cas2 [Parcubacteria group bacterium]|nr:CRISPR-associated endonuclease Cas2 [Parcubacteria group bacterium]
MRNSTKKKVLILLGAGLALGLTRSPQKYYKIIKATHGAFKDFNRKYLIQLIKEFKYERLIEFKENPDGTIKVVLTEDGVKKVLTFDIDKLQIKTPKKWDKKWRLVIFDIPDKKKKVREVFREKLKELGFRQYQESIYVIPYECENEIDFIVEFYQVRNFVRLVTATKITNEAELKLKFKLV